MKFLLVALIQIIFGLVCYAYSSVASGMGVHHEPEYAPWPDRAR
jgi:hypothetical protein